MKKKPHMIIYNVEPYVDVDCFSINCLLASVILKHSYVWLFSPAAHEAGYYSAEIAPIDVKAKKGKVVMTHDEHPRPQTTLEQLAKLPPVFKKGGTVTAANASVGALLR